MLAFEENQILKAVQVLNRGGVIAYPTETLYGVGADATNEQAVKKVYQMKGRDFAKPLLVAVSSFKQIEDISIISKKHLNILEKFLPGPYTFLLPDKNKLPNAINSGLDLVGIRYPDHKIALEIIKKFGRPITSTSANLSGQESIFKFEEIDLDVDYIVRGKCKYQQGSTIIDLTTNEIVREGVGLEKARQYFG